MNQDTCFYCENKIITGHFCEMQIRGVPSSALIHTLCIEDYIISLHLQRTVITITPIGRK